MGLLLGLMGASRLAMGAHHPTDLLAGMVVGSLGGLFCQRLAPRLEPRLERLFAKGGF
jgi:membrane-associated phospholipid phosphatase